MTSWKRWIKRGLIGLLALGALGGTFAAFSHHAHSRWGWHAMSEEDAAEFKARMVDRVGSKLDLDPAQKARLAALADRLREQRNAFIGEHPDPRAEMQSLIAGPAFDRNRAQVLVQAMTQAVQAKSPEVIAAMADFYDSLRPEQQARVREFLARRHRRS